LNTIDTFVPPGDYNLEIEQVAMINWGYK